MLMPVITTENAYSAIGPDESYFGKKIHSIEYSVEPSIDRTHYDPYLGIHPGDLLTRSALKRGIQSLYDSGRFSSVAVDAVPEGDGIILNFKLQHNYYFNNFSLEGDVDLKGRSLWEWVSLPIGKRYTDAGLEESRRMVLDFLKNRGFYLAQVVARTIRDDKFRQVDVVFDVQPGELARIGSIKIQGVPEWDLRDLSEKFGFREGEEFERSRLADRQDSLRKHFTNEGYLAAEVKVDESFDSKTNTVDLILDISNYGKVRVVVDGFKIDKNQLRRLLPVLTGEGIREEILQEGKTNLKEYLENRGYSEAVITVYEEKEENVLVLRYKIVPNNKSTVK
jgi:outer membrane protein assembly factor BamA